MKGFINCSMAFLVTLLFVGCMTPKGTRGHANVDGGNANEENTVTVHDTIVIHDTIIVHDTIVGEVPSPKDPVVGNSSEKTLIDFDNISLQPVNNSKYTLQNLHLVMQGMGDSHDQQMARDNAKSDAFNSLTDVFNKTIKHIAKKRGLKKISIDRSLIQKNASIISEKPVGYKDSNGKLVYRYTRTVQLNSESILKDVYSRMKPSKSYSYAAFCRDFDYLIGKIKNKLN